MPLESKRVIELVGPFALGVGRENQFVTAVGFGLLHSKLHHELSYSLSLNFWQDSNILHHRRFFAQVGQIVHDQKGKGSNNLLPGNGNIKTVKRILLKNTVNLFCLFEREQLSCIQLRLPIYSQNARQMAPDAASLSK